jgi:hypothetical protein
MSNDKIAKDEVRENLGFKIDMTDFYNFELLVSNTNIMASIVSGNIERLLDFVSTSQDQNKNVIKKRLQEIDLLFTFLEGQINAAQDFMNNTLTLS